jgi:hypothetical protein
MTFEIYYSPSSVIYQQLYEGQRRRIAMEIQGGASFF